MRIILLAFFFTFVGCVSFLHCAHRLGLLLFQPVRFCSAAVLLLLCHWLANLAYLPQLASACMHHDSQLIARALRVGCEIRFIYLLLHSLHLNCLKLELLKTA